MNNFIIGVFQLLVGLLFLFAIIAGATVGYRILGENEAGGLLGAAAALLGCSVLLGPLLILIRIDDNVRALRRHFVRAEPTEIDLAKAEVRALEQDVNDILRRRQDGEAKPRPT